MSPLSTLEDYDVKCHDKRGRVSILAVFHEIARHLGDRGVDYDRNPQTGKLSRADKKRIDRARRQAAQNLKITKKALHKAMACMAAIAPKQTKHVIGSGLGCVRVLVDENLPQRYVLSLHKRFGPATHTDYMGLTGKKDREVYEQSFVEGFDMIVTLDQAQKKKTDLTCIATERALDVILQEGPDSPVLQDLPVVVRFKWSPKAAKEVPDLLRKYQPELIALALSKKTPYVTLTHHRIQLGPTYEDLAAEYWSERQSRTTLKAQFHRVDRWRDQWVERMKEGYEGRILTPKDERRLRHEAKKAAKISFEMRGKPKPA
jgi:hypothetical protein